MSELIHVPFVVLTERAFNHAQSKGILDIQPDRDQMLAVGQLTETGADYLPDITVLRDYSLTNFDVSYKNAPVDYQYLPSSELAVQERGQQTISAGGLRQHTAETAKKLIELSVSNWDRLGEEFVKGIEESKTLEKGNPGQVVDRAANAFGWLLSGLLRDPQINSASNQHVLQGRNLQPYAITRK